MALGTEGYRAALLAKIEDAGALGPSFETAAQMLDRLGELAVSAKHAQRITERIGRERTQQRQRQVEQMQARVLQPAYREPPQVAAIHLDAGKIRLRADDGAPGVRQPHWSDTKVGCFQTYTSLACEHDPQPDPPAVSEAVGERPQRLVRTAVATREGTEGFGWMVAAEAMRRGFYHARRRAIVGDGGNWIAPLGQRPFPGWVQVLDFLHLLVHLYAAATAAYENLGSRGRFRVWRLYEQMLRAAWAGQVGQVQTLLREHLERLGPASKEPSGKDPRKVLSSVLDYVHANADRMDYARYRRDGLPVTSTLVESLIKQFNTRVKGTEKFWSQEDAEAILQSRAAYLSQDGRAEAFYAHRPRGRAVGANRLRRPA